MINSSPITPPKDLIEKLQDLGNLDAIELAYQAGADQELEACIEWIYQHFQCGLEWSKDLRAARRPNPLSLKEQALRELGDAYDREKIDDTTYDTIKRALEALPND
jgi:hypothetical protein